MALTKEQLDEIREFLAKAERPLFFYDDDPDGLCSFLLLRKKAGKGYGIAIKRGIDEESLLSRKIFELSPDVIFFLDKPTLPQNIIDSFRVPVVWIDHHQPLKFENKNIHYYNPMSEGKGDNRCTSYWAHRVVEENDWIAAAGIIADWQIPDFLDRFEYKELIGNPKTPGEAMFNTEYSILVKVFSFALKGSVSEVKANVNTLLKVESPTEILKQTTSRGRFLWKQYEKINKEYESLVKKARKAKADGDLLLFTYPNGKTSFTGMISNELMHNNPDKVVIVARDKEDMMVLSLRSIDLKVLPALQKALKEVRGYGGGHVHACGAGVNKDDFPKFLEIIKENIKKKQP